MYKWNAVDYAQNSSGQEQWARELLPLLNLCESDRVLDIGCGDGRITAEIAARVPRGRVLGIDSSIDMVRHASDRFSAIPNLTFLHCDARELNVEAEFTVVFSNAALHWIRDQASVILRIGKALRPSGRLITQCGGDGNGQYIIESFLRVADRGRWSSRFVNFKACYGFYTPEDHRCWLEAAGLEVDDVRLISKDMVHTDRATFAGYLRSAWHPYTSPVPAELRETFIAEVVDDYLKRYPADSNGRVHLRMVRLQARAHKPM